jgi:hypothetical protein
MLRAIGDKIPGLSGERVERAVLDASASFMVLARDKRVMAWALLWASLNWLLDAASLWCFVAAFGSRVNPVELFAAYGISNVAGALPVSPGGLGIIDSAAPLLLVGFGVTRSVATLGVLGWRMVNFWLPIPTGAAAYVSLKVKPHSEITAIRSAVTNLLAPGLLAPGLLAPGQLAPGQLPNGKPADDDPAPRAKRGEHAPAERAQSEHAPPEHPSAEDRG